MSLCQRGSIVSSAPRRSNCTVCCAPVLALLRPRPALAHPEHRLLIELERQAAILFEHDLLHRLTGGVGDDDRERAGANVDVERADAHATRARELANAQRRRRILAVDDRGVSRKVVLEADGLERDSDAAIARGADVELCGLARGSDGLGLRGCCDTDERNGKGRNEAHGRECSPRARQAVSG